MVASSLVRRVHAIVEPAALVVLAALADRASLLSLSPVYGALPSSAYHDALPLLAFLLAMSMLLLDIVPPRQKLATALPMHASLSPSLIYYVLGPLSSTMGPAYGPILTEALTVLPTITMILCLLIDTIQEYRPKTLDAIMPTMALPIAFLLIRNTLQGYLVPLIGQSPWLTRWSLEALVSCSFVLLYPSKLLFLALVPALSFLLSTSPHGPLPANERRLLRNLRPEGYRLLARKESVTGYLSVLESESSNFRVLRCDHSLLGGVWLPTEARKSEGIIVAEPVFPVFTMLETVRLMVDSGTDASQEKAAQDALVIGLGIGTCPAALSAHGINTTTLELDPAVTEIARSFFGFESRSTSANSKVVHGDALQAVSGLSESDAKFSYIIHDVFTGGAEPIALFTADFMAALKSLLAPGGTIAVNYAGDLSLPTTTLALDIIFSTFTHCKAYRDEPRATSDTTSYDFANIVVFCAEHEWAFRKPTEADFLKSQARRHSMLPKHEIDMDALPRVANGRVTLTPLTWGLLQSTQTESARNHWRIMRTVLPKAVWLNW